MGLQNADPVDRQRFQVGWQVITRLFKTLVAHHLRPWKKPVQFFQPNLLTVHVIVFAIQQFSLQTLRMRRLGQETNPIKALV